MATGKQPPSSAEILERFTKSLNEKGLLEASVEWKARTNRRRKVSQVGSAEWTNVLMNVLQELGFAYGYKVWPRRYYLSAATGPFRNCRLDGRADDRGEWMLDACWTQYAMLKEWAQAVRDTPSGESPPAGIYLACESEWGAGKARVARVDAILDDFAKLVEVRAKVKVLFFGFDEDGEKSKSTFGDITTFCDRIASTDTTGANYLLIGWPNSAKWDERMATMRTHVLV